MMFDIDSFQIFPEFKTSLVQRLKFMLTFSDHKIFSVENLGEHFFPEFKTSVVQRLKIMLTFSDHKIFSVENSGEHLVIIKFHDHIKKIFIKIRGHIFFLEKISLPFEKISTIFFPEKELK